jgi:hypothetical protein
VFKNSHYPVRAPIVMVAVARRAKEQADSATDVVGRGGSNLHLGVTVFEVLPVILAVVVVEMAGCWSHICDRSDRSKYLQQETGGRSRSLY